MACKVLHDSRLTLSHQGRVPGQDTGELAERGYCDWRTRDNFFVSLAQVAIMKNRSICLTFFTTFGTPQV